jgi:hypothetical protein
MAREVFEMALPATPAAAGGTATTRARMVAAAVAGAALLALVPGCGDPVQQPLAFSHKIHAEQEIECTDCHKYPRTQTFSGLPTVEDCMECHEDPLTKSAEEEKIRTAAKEGRELRWRRLFRVPDHVYYSHRRHVVLADLPCKTCHGTTGASERPPPVAPVQITMDFCIDCHSRSNVPVDCVNCHR